MINNYIYKFTNTDATIEDLKDSKYYKMLDNCINNDYEILKKHSKEKYYRDLFKNGYLKLMGYILNFRPFLKIFLVAYKCTPDTYYKIYAYNKTCLYKHFGRYNIIDVVEKNR